MSDWFEGGRCLDKILAKEEVQAWHVIVAKEDAKYVIGVKAKEVEETSSVPWRRTRIGSCIPAPSPFPRALRSRT
jgi:hypothetical protein